MNRTTSTNDFVLLKGLSLQRRLPLLMGLLLLLVISAFTIISYISARNAALKTGKERLNGLGEQLSAMFGQSAESLLNSTRNAAAEEPLKNYLRQGRVFSDTAARGILNRLRSDSNWLLTELLDVFGSPVLQSAAAGLHISAERGTVLSSLVSSTVSVGKLYRHNDSIIYPVIAAVRDKNKNIGYLLRWRLQTASERAIMQFSELLGTGAKLYIGNKDHSLWTDLRSPVELPPESGSAEQVAEKPILNTAWLIRVEFSRAVVLQPATASLQWYLFIGGILLVLGSVITWFISRGITRPVKKLTAVASAVAGGHYSLKVNLQRRDELGQLADTFNTMMEKIRTASEMLEATVKERTAELEKNIVQLRESELKFRGLLEAAPDAMVIVNDKGEIILINKQTESLFNYTSDELNGKPVEILLPDTDKEKHIQHRAGYFKLPRIRSMGAGLELFAIRKDGTKFPVEISLSPLETSTGTLVSAAIRDITERKKAEEKFKGLLESAPDAMIIADRRGLMVLVNKQTEKLFGYSREELTGQPVEILIPQETRSRHEEHRANYYQQPKIRSMGAGLELFAVRKDSSQFPVEISLSPLETSEGMLVSAAIRDISERKEADEAIRQLNKELESFTYSVSHDLRAPLRIIDGYANILIEDYTAKLDENGNRTLGIIKTNARRMGQLIDDLLSLSHTGRIEPNMQLTDMNKLVKNIVDEQLSLTGSKAIVKLEKLDPAECDSSLIRQVWINLISNAIKYSGKLEQPVIEIHSSRSGKGISYTVKDNGVGFDMKYADKLFGVFQRLHKVSEFEGTGIGLALVNRIILKHGGKLSVEAAPGKGAAFTFTLPG